MPISLAVWAAKMQELRPQIFAFASNEWHTPWWMARQHLFTRLARRGWPVLYSTGPQSLWERKTDKWRRGSFTHRFDTVQISHDTKVLVDRPGKLLPLWRDEGVWRDFVVGRHARHLLIGQAFGGPRRRIAYLWNPRFWSYVEQLGADYVVFHIHDAWNANAWSATQKKNLRDLVKRADLIITTAENMSRDLPGIGPENARTLPHGVDFDAVRAGAAAACPADLAAIPRPRIGYIGRVNLKLDFPEIIKAAAARPDWHWVFVGATGIGTSYSFDGNPSVKLDWQRLNQMENVHFLGVKHRSEVPAYLHNFDVLSLPFNSSYVGFPTKLFEYFASGKPIISWNGENVRSFSHVMDIANGAEDWISAIDRTLSGAGKGTPSQRIDLARAEDWNSRADTLECWLREMIR
jgi:glycosyltransferase involved in cell wall biosynthesis